MSLKDEHLEDATILGQGNFKLDRRRAMEKLSRFQLEDPHRYVLELISAAICAGSTEITVRNDADDLELTWDGDHPTEAELEGLFDHIFYRGEDPRQRMLQHLAQGLYGALGLSPRWIRLQRPGLSLDFTDPLAVSEEANERTAGVFVHVRERFSWKVFVEAVSPFDDAYETRLLRERASLSPVPIRVNGALISDRVIAAPADAPVRADGTGRLWLATEDALPGLDPRLGEGVLLTRDGVSVQSIVLEAPPLRLVGWLDAPELQLNASRSAAVEDRALASVQARLKAHLEALLRAHLANEVRSPSIVDAVLRYLADDPGAAPVFSDVPLFLDALGRRWSHAELKKQKTLWRLGDAELLSEDFTAPLFLTPEALRRRGHHHHDELLLRVWATVTAVFGKLDSAAPRLRRIHTGRLRRQALARKGVQMGFGSEALLVSRVDVAGLGGEIALLKSPSTGLRIELWADNLPVEVIEIPTFPNIAARVSSPDFTTDLTFSKVLDGEARRSVRGTVLDGAGALLALAGETLPEHPVVQAGLRAWLGQQVREHGPDLDAWLATLSPVLTDAPLFETLGGELRSMRELAGRAVGTFAAERSVDLKRAVDDKGLELPAALRDGVLLASRDDRRVLKRLLGHRLTDRTEEVMGTATALWRKSQPPLRPQLDTVVEHRATVGRDGLQGVIGLRFAGRPALVRIIHEGVDLGSYDLKLPLPGAVAAVEWREAVPDASWARLADRSQLKHLSSLLREPFTALVVRAMDHWKGAEAVPAWLVSALERPLDKSLLKHPWFTTLGGEDRSIHALKRKRSVRYVLSRPDIVVPGLEDAVLLNTASLEILKKHLGRRKLSDASKRVEEVKLAWSRFTGRAVVPLALPRGVRYHDRQSFRTGELQGVVGVRLGGDLTPLVRIHCLHERRMLETIFAPHFLVVDAVVWGAAVEPNVMRTSLGSASAKQAIIGAVEGAVAALVAGLVQDPRAPGEIQLKVLDQLLRRQPLPGLEGKAAREAAIASLRARPLIRSLSGQRHSLDVLVEAHRSGNLRAVDRDEERPPSRDERIWVPSSDIVQRLFKATLRRSLPSSSAELAAWHKANRRRQSLETVPARPPGRHLAIQSLSDGEAETWIALTSAMSDATVIEWRVESRIIRRDTRPGEAPLLVRVSDPALRPSDAFDRVQPGKAHTAALRRVDEQVPGFLRAVALRLRTNGAPDTTGAVSVTDLARARGAVLGWAAGNDLGEDWADIHLLTAADGRTLGPVQLKAMAARGALRVVGAQTRGRTLDPQRPAIPCSDANKRFLRRYGRVVDYTQELAREEVVHVRRAQPGIPQNAPKGPEVLLSRPAPEGRQGFVQVRLDGKNQLGLFEQWRPLNTISPAGPIPLVGKISDDALEPDERHEAALKDDAYYALTDAVAELSAGLLPELLEILRPDDHQKLILTIASRAFRSRRAVAAAVGDWGRLADLPVFSRGDGQPISLRGVAELPGEPRWVPLDLAAPSLKPERPFVRIAPNLLDVVHGLLGGRMAEAAAREEAAAIARSRVARLPFVLPDMPGVETVTRTYRSFRMLVGIAPGPLRVGSLHVRCGGIPVQHRNLPLVGLVAVAEVPESAVSKTWSRAEIPKRAMRELELAHKELLHAALPARLSDRQGLAQVVELLNGNEAVAALIRGAPMIATPSGHTSLLALDRLPAFLLHEASVAARFGEVRAVPPPSVLPSRANLRLLQAVGLDKKAEMASRWLERQIVTEAQIQAAERVKVAERRARGLQGQVTNELVQRLRGTLPKKAIKAAVSPALLQACPLYEGAVGGDRKATLLVVAAVMDHLLHDKPNTLAEALAELAGSLA